MAVVLGPLLVLVLLAGVLVAVIELSFGPIHLGDYSLSGPHTWVSFPGRARTLINCAGYRLWKRQDPPVRDGT